MAHKICGKQTPPSKREYSLGEKVVDILDQARALNPDDYHSLVCELIKRSPCSNELIKKQMNFARDSISNRNRTTQKLEKAVGQSNGKGKVCERQSSDDPGAPSSSSSNGNMCERQRANDTGAASSCSTKGKACERQSTDDPGAPSFNSASGIGSSPASKVSLIIRGDLIDKANRFHVDTEKVTEASTHHPVSGDLAIVDDVGRLVFWCYIKRDKVCKYNTKLTGLDSEKLKMGLDVDFVHLLLEKLFTGKTLTGADLRNDLKSLGICSSKLTFAPEDIQDFYRDYKGDKISLAYLGEHFLGENVQGITHSSIKDARLTALCYQKMLKFKEMGMQRFSCPVMDEVRSDSKNNPKHKQNLKYDRCMCGVKNAKESKRRNAIYSVDKFNLNDYM